MTVCAKCGVENPEGSTACRMCGGSLVAVSRRCVSCGRSLDWDVNVCPYCGHDFRIVATGPVQTTVGTGLRIVFYILSFLIPVAGIIIGIVFLTRDSPDEKHVGKICVILGVVSIVLTIGATALMYLWLLEFSGGEVSTPTTVLSKTPVIDGYKFTFGPVTDEVAWSHVSILLCDDSYAVSWSLVGMSGTPPAIQDYATYELGPVFVTLSLMDVAANGVIDMGDSFTLTSSTGFSAVTTYTVTVLYEPTSEAMCLMSFSG